MHQESRSGRQLTCLRPAEVQKVAPQDEDDVAAPAATEEEAAAGLAALRAASLRDQAALLAAAEFSLSDRSASIRQTWATKVSAGPPYIGLKPSIQSASNLPCNSLPISLHCILYLIRGCRDTAAAEQRLPPRLRV